MVEDTSFQIPSPALKTESWAELNGLGGKAQPSHINLTQIDEL